MTAYAKRIFSPLVPCSSEAFVFKGFTYWLRVSRRRAHSLGLTGSDADDYVSAFLFRCACGKSASAALRYRSGVHGGIDYLRGRQRTVKHETAWPDKPCAAFEPAASDFSPETCVMQSEVQKRISHALLRLTKEQQDIFRLCVVEEKSALKQRHKQTAPPMRFGKPCATCSSGCGPF